MMGHPQAALISDCLWVKVVSECSGWLAVAHFNANDDVNAPPRG